MAVEVERLLKGSSTKGICGTSTGAKGKYLQEFSRSAAIAVYRRSPF